MKYRLQFRLRALFQTLYSEQILIPELKTFRLSNCAAWKVMEEMLTGAGMRDGTLIQKINQEAFTSG